MIEISEVGIEDRGAALALIEASRLPRAGLENTGLRLWVARADGVVVGVAGLEPYGDVALLRSVATDERHREHGVATSLCGAVVEAARAGGARRVYLLTETAERFFRRLGFESQNRSEADPRLLVSAEFQGNQCASAQLMARRV